MKRILIIAMTLLITALCITACSGGGTEENIKEPSEEVIQPVKKEEEKEPETVVEEEKNELLPYTYKVPYDGYKVYVDIPEYPQVASGYTRIYPDGLNKFVSFAVFTDGEASDAKSAFDLIYKDFKPAVDDYIFIDAENITETENLEVNGIPVYRFKGTVTAGTFRVCEHYIYGYSFVFDNLPCAIIGIVTDKDQPQEEIDSVTEIVDEMIKTVRGEY